MSITVGQKLYCPPAARRGRSEMEYTVEKIGRKWITLDSGSWRKARCTVEDLKLDCSPYGMRQLYTNREEYMRVSRLKSAWADLCRDTSRAAMPDGMTVETINAIRLQLGLEVLPTA